MCVSFEEHLNKTHPWGFVSVLEYSLIPFAVPREIDWSPRALGVPSELELESA